MANAEHVDRLKQGVDAWNTWRQETPDLRPDLREADLHRANLHRANLHRANLHRTNLRSAKLHRANLQGANLYRADLGSADLQGAVLRRANLRWADLGWAGLREADLGRADLGEADLRRANLEGADLGRANLRQANLEGADLGRVDLGRADLRGAVLCRANLEGARLYEAILDETVLANVDLTEVRGLETCKHNGPSSIDHRTLEQSGPLPLEFLRGVGLPDRLIEYLPSLLNQPLQFYSCFISYSSKDQEFAERLHADLQNKGVRCWFAPHDLPIGAKTWDTIDEAIRLRDKVLLILSENAIASDWVEDEVNKAFSEERERKQTILFPVRLDDVVMQTSEPWARKLRDQRHIGNFIGWKDHDCYRKGFERVMRDLKAEQAPKI